METHTLPHFPPPLSVVHLALFTDVTNAAALRSRLIAASTMEGEEGEREREVVNFAFVDAKLITSRQHILTAVYQAVLAASKGAMRTKTVHSEILFALNPNMNISDAIRRFGASSSTTSLLVVRVCGPVVAEEGLREGTTTVDWDCFTPEEMYRRMAQAVQGRLTSLDALGVEAGEGGCVTDWNGVEKCYKVGSDPVFRLPLANEKEEKEQSRRRTVDRIVTSIVAMKVAAA